MRTINISDITLKKLSEDRAISLLFREKSAIANCADVLGAEAVELPPVKNLREDANLNQTQLGKTLGITQRKLSRKIVTAFCILGNL